MKKSILRKSKIIGVITILFVLCLTSTMGIVYHQIDRIDNVTMLEIKSVKQNLNSFGDLLNIRSKDQEISNNYFSENNNVNLGKELLFEKIIQKLMGFVHLSSLSAAIVKDTECVWTGGYGIYDRENNKKTTDETIYIVASISKTFTATAIMQLYEKGYFDLDDNINNYLPFSLRNPKFLEDNITIRMLLAHQSSIAEDLPTFFTRAMPGGLEILGYPYPFLKDYLIPDGIHYKPQVWTDFSPGEQMYYSNTGYGILGYLVEILSGSSFEEYCYNNIFKPLGMNNSSFFLTNLNISKVAVPYDFQSGKYYPYIYYEILVYPAGGLRTSVLDLSHFLLAFMNGGVYGETRILSKESVDEMHKIQYPSDNYDFQYGLGWQIWEKSSGTKIGHTGGLFGVATKMAFKKSDKTGIIYFMNKDLWNYRDLFAYSLIEKLLFWKANSFNHESFQNINLRDTINSNKHILKDFNKNNNHLIDLT